LNFLRHYDYAMWVLLRLSIRAARAKRLNGRRFIGTKYLQKAANAKLAWKDTADRIRAGEERSIFDILEERGLVNGVVGQKEGLKNLVTNKRTGAYLGIDPTAPSLHVGHLLPLMIMFWWYVKGCKSITLVGNANICRLY